MNFFQRLWTGLSFALSGKVAYEVRPAWEQGGVDSGSAGFEQNVRQGYKLNELIFACVSLKADSAAQPVLRVLRKRDEVELPDHPLAKLLEQPNDFMTAFDFMSITLTYLDLAGRAYWEKVTDRTGRVIQMWPLRPDWVKVIPVRDGFIGGYRYAVPGVPLDKQPVLKPDQVLDFKLWDPLNMYGSLAPASVASRVAGVDNAATDFLQQFFRYGGMPMGLIKTRQKLIDSSVTDIRRRWRERYGGYAAWIDPAVLDSDAEYQRTGLTFKEMGFETLDWRAEGRVCQVLRTPPILVGASVGLARSTYSNYGEARRAYWQDTLTPQYKRVRDELQNDLARRHFGGDVILHWDFSGVPALQEENNARWTRATAAFVAGGLTVNMFMTEVGLPQIGPSGDVFLRGAGTVEVPLGGERPKITASAPPADTPMLEADAEDDEGDGDKARLPAPEVKRTGDAPDDAQRRRRERAMQSAVQGFLADQAGRVREQLPDAAE